MSCVIIKGHWQILQQLAASDKGLHYLHYLHKANAYLSLTKTEDENKLIYKNGDPQLIKMALFHLLGRKTPSGGTNGLK